MWTGRKHLSYRRCIYKCVNKCRRQNVHPVRHKLWKISPCTMWSCSETSWWAGPVAARLNLRLLSCQPGKWKPLRHFTVKPADLAHITFQFSYINWDVLSTCGWLLVSKHTLAQTEAHNSAHTHTHTKSTTSFPLSVGKKEDILFAKLINIPSFGQLFLYVLYHKIPVPRISTLAHAHPHTA